jgi:hypothetical protein
MAQSTFRFLRHSSSGRAADKPFSWCSVFELAAETTACCSCVFIFHPGSRFPSSSGDLGVRGTLSNGGVPLHLPGYPFVHAMFELRSRLCFDC